MKKIIIALIIAVMAISLFSCGEQAEGWQYGDYMSEELYNEYVDVYENEWKELAARVLALADNEYILANDQAVAVIDAVAKRQEALEKLCGDVTFIPTYVEALANDPTPEDMLENIRQLIDTLPPAIESLERIASGN